MLLAGDIGGTKTELAILSDEAGPCVLLTQTEVHSADYAGLTTWPSDAFDKLLNLQQCDDGDPPSATPGRRQLHQR